VRKAKIADLKDNLSRYLQYVRRGGSILVLDRDLPIAKIVPLEPDPGRRADDNDRLARLARQGLIRRGTGDPGAWLARHRPVRVPGGVLTGLLEERRSGW
jgi:antitoxin (DNA-binding transcriptional repressor) of toxin-antitoxin stability system